MALIGINPVQAEAKGPSTLDRILQGVQIAQGILGTALEIPKFLQQRRVGKLEEEKTKAEVERIKAESQPLTDVERSAYQKAGVPEIALPKSRGGIADALRFIETPQQKTSRERQEKLLEIAVLGSARAIRKEDREITEAVKKEEEEKLKKFVPLLNQYVPDADTAKKTNDALGKTSEVLTKLNRLIDVRTRFSGGTADLTERKKAEQIARSLQLDIKGPEFAQLGVLTGPDLQLLETQIPKQPLGFAPTTVLGFEDPIMAGLRQAVDLIKLRMQSGLTAKGLNIPEGFFDNISAIKKLGTKKITKERADTF